MRSAKASPRASASTARSTPCLSVLHQAGHRRVRSPRCDISRSTGPACDRRHRQTRRVPARGESRESQAGRGVLVEAHPAGRKKLHAGLRVYWRPSRPLFEGVGRRLPRCRELHSTFIPHPVDTGFGSAGRRSGRSRTAALRGFCHAATGRSIWNRLLRPRRLFDVERIYDVTRILVPPSGETVAGLYYLKADPANRDVPDL